MKLTAEQKKIIDNYANSFAYYVQDILDDIASGKSFNIKKVEKDFKNDLVDLVEELK